MKQTDLSINKGKIQVCLILPRMKYATGDLPLGIAYIASLLRKSEICDLDLIDMTFDKGFGRVTNLLKNKSYDIVGFSVMSSMHIDALKIASIIKRANPNSVIVFGGPHPTTMPEDTINCPQVDAICIGEAELTFMEIVAKKGKFDRINGVWYKWGKKIIKNKPREYIKSLDRLPYPALDMLPINKYFKYWFQMDSVAHNLKGISIMASRGCYYNCSNCQPTVSKLFGKKVRKRQPKKIVEELLYWKNKYKITAFMFLDDTFVFDKKWVKNICYEIEKADLKLIWACNSRVDLIDKKLFKIMKKAGLRKVFLGIECASQRILNDIYNKGLKKISVSHEINKLKELGLKIQGHFMIGAPTESINDIRDTINLAKNLAIDEAAFHITTPLPGTHLYHKTKQLIGKEIGFFDYYRTSVYNSKAVLSSQKLNILKKTALLSFYLSKRRILSTVFSFFTITGFMKNLLKLKRF
ncbi:MAG: radical SAM protein [Nanoarchaeota archaeon]